MLSVMSVTSILSFLSSHAVNLAPCKNGRVSSANTFTFFPPSIAPRITPLDAGEPAHIGEATARLGLSHVVVTTIEILTPDFLRKPGALEVVVAAKPDVFNHNLETVPSNYLTVRPGARYFHSIRLLQRVKEIDPAIFTKSGIMVGLGEERHEILQVMDDLRSAD